MSFQHLADPVHVRLRLGILRLHRGNLAVSYTHLDVYKRQVNANVTDAAALIEKYDIVTAAVAEKALPYCNITFIEGTEMQEKLSGYLNVLYEQNPTSVGGALPADDFYYIR